MNRVSNLHEHEDPTPITEQTLNEKIREHYSTLNGVTIAISGVKVKVGFLYSATYLLGRPRTARFNNLASGS